tara:strand:+ start:3156 stop:3767 length:612 start_codon:yes stop_codon:yes gene_type:complete
MSQITIGISMRETDATNYIEKRDSIAKDWFVFLKKIMPNAKFILIPNIKEDIIDYIKYWKLNSFILTGGENFGLSDDRDFSEKLIFEYSQNNSFPILGICRGLQGIYKWLGGKININVSKFHDSNRHEIKLFNELVTVNSFHKNILEESSKPKVLKIIARCNKDSTIEACSGKNILGLMWHPEREEIINSFDKKIIRQLFKYE